MFDAGTITMPRKKEDKPVEQAAGLTNVKVRTDVHRKLRTVASYRGVDLADLVDELLRPIAERLEREMGQEIAAKK